MCIVAKGISALFVLVVCDTAISARTSAPDRALRIIAVRADGVPLVRLDASELADARLRQDMREERMEIATDFSAEIGTEPSARHTCIVTYDHWTSRYRVELSDRVLLDQSEGDAIDACLRIDALPVGTPEDWENDDATRVPFMATVEIEPLTPHKVQSIRQWLRESDAEDEDPLFGRIVGIFVNRQLGPERSFDYRARPASAPASR